MSLKLIIKDKAGYKLNFGFSPKALVLRENFDLNVLVAKDA
jgi:hypothetical protein